MVAVSPIDVRPLVIHDPFTDIKLWPAGIQLVGEIEWLDIPQLGAAA